MLNKFEKDNDLFHSDYQIENYILISNGHTEYGIYKQALRELFSRQQSLRGLYAKKMEIDLAFEEIQLDIKDLETKMIDPEKADLPRDDIAMKRVRIKEAEIVYGKRDMLKVISETEREFKKFYSCASYLKDRLGDIPDERKLILEEEYWKEVIKDSIASDFKVAGGLTAQTLKRIEESSSKVRSELLHTVQMLQSNDQSSKQNFFSKYPLKLEFPKDLNVSLPCEIKLLVENNVERNIQ